MRWRILLGHEHGTVTIPNVIEGDTVNVPEGLAIRSVGLEPEPDQSVIPPTSVPGGPPEPSFGETPMDPTPEPDATLLGEHEVTEPGPDRAGTLIGNTEAPIPPGV